MADRLPQLLGVLALAATDRFRGAVEGSLGRAGAHAPALVHLDAHPGGSVTDLAAVLGVSAPAAVKLADRLARDGLLERPAGPGAPPPAPPPPPARPPPPGPPPGRGPAAPPRPRSWRRGRTSSAIWSARSRRPNGRRSSRCW